MTAASVGEPVVLLIEDEPAVRDALRRLFTTVGLKVIAFGSAAELLKDPIPEDASCLVLDVRLPGRSGLDLQSELAKAGVRLPIIFMSGHGDIPMTVQAMKAGAVDFLTKPFRDQDMLDAVTAAIERDRQRRAEERVAQDVRNRHRQLTDREKEVLILVSSGLMNKQIAAEMGLSEITVKIHRGRMMKKMGARSLADLVRMADAIGVRRDKA